MFETTDLPSYIPGYDEYIADINKQEEYDFTDELLDELKIRRELDKMERKIIDLTTTSITLEEAFSLENYIIKNNKLIPAEMLEEK